MNHLITLDDLPGDRCSAAMALASKMRIAGGTISIDNITDAEEAAAGDLELCGVANVFSISIDDGEPIYRFRLVKTSPDNSADCPF